MSYFTIVCLILYTYMFSGIISHFHYKKKAVSVFFIFGQFETLKN